MAISILVIDAGYRFEGVGVPLERFEFASGTLTRPVATGIRKAPASQNPLYAACGRSGRIGSGARSWPSYRRPCLSIICSASMSRRSRPTGFPIDYSRRIRLSEMATSNSPGRRPARPIRASAGILCISTGVMRNTGWWYYYVFTLLYKVPEGTWVLVLLSLLVLAIQRRTREAWADEICLWTVPVVVLFSMSFLTDINLGLRYVLSIAPYVFIAAGKVVPWVEGLSGWRRADRTDDHACGRWADDRLGSWIHPHYLAYFNWVSGGPDRVPARLIDSNLDWGQDLVALRDVVPRAHARGSRSAWRISVRSIHRLFT